MRVSESLCLLENETDASLGAGLSPTQENIYHQILRFLGPGSICVLKGIAGMGKSTVLRALAHAHPAAVLSTKDFLGLLLNRQPAAIEETFLELAQNALAQFDTVFFDDFDLLLNVVGGFDYPRSHLLDAVLTALLQETESRNKCVLFAVANEEIPSPIQHRAQSWQIERLKTEDYRSIGSKHLSTQKDSIDWEEIYRFAPALNAYQIRNAACWLTRGTEAITTQVFIDYLETHNLTSNVHLEEVASVDWKDLKGVDDVIRELEAKIALPFENDALCKELKLRPKRGVLLAGPPGTGKTTIGRALAHRLKSKFFLIDGTVVAGSRDFYETVGGIFEKAKKNAPAIIFIDDADVIFESGDKGFYRYLLTQMDGLESASAERVCVMLTAMEASALPPAVLRSGRVELWLETRLPDEPARATIFRERLAQLPPPTSLADIDTLAKASRGLSGADLKSVVEDAKLLFAHDIVSEKEAEKVEAYFLRAIAAIRAKAISYGKHRGTGFPGSAFGFRNADQSR
jgi:SpoVK/Ycf46/Vps4 family AAA+-type ATPase